MKSAQRLMVGAIALSIAINANAGIFVGPGATGSDFLNVPTDARSAAMAGAVSSLSGHIDALEYNPAGLIGLDRTHVAATYIGYLQSSSFQSLSIGAPFGASVPRLRRANASGISTQQRFAAGLQYKAFRANDTGRNEVGVETGDFDIRNQSIGASVAYALDDRLMLGLGGKYLSNKIQDLSVTSYAADAGAIFDFTDRISGGVSLINMGASQKFDQQSEPLPTTLRVGGSYRMPTWLANVELSEGRDKVLVAATGVEYQPVRFLNFRAGVLHNTDIEITGGLGLMIAGPTKAAPYDSGTERERNPRSLGGLDTAPSKPRDPSILDRVDFGLDYAIQTRKDLGFSHTVTLRVLY